MTEILRRIAKVRREVAQIERVVRAIAEACLVEREVKREEAK